MENRTYLNSEDNLEHRRSETSEFWLAQLEVRLSKIEFILARLEWSILLISGGLCTVLGFEVLAFLKGV